MENHYNSHDKRHDVHSRRGTFEDDGVGKGDIASIAIWFDANAVGGRERWPNVGAKRKRRILADGGEVSKARHLVDASAMCSPTELLLQKSNLWMNKEAGYIDRVDRGAREASD